MASDSQPEYLVKHPLTNDLIIRKVFKYCPSTFDSVKDMRLVCKAWKIASDAAWRSITVPLTILKDDNYQQEQENLPERTITLSKFLEQQSDPSRSNFPNRNFVLKKWKISDKHFVHHSGATVSLKQRFWSMNGQNITILTMSGCTLPWSQRLFGKSFLLALPNLERLSLLNCSFVTRPSGLEWFVANLGPPPRPREMMLQNEEFLPVELGIYNYTRKHYLHVYQALPPPDIPNFPQPRHVRRRQSLLPMEFHYINFEERRKLCNEHLKSLSVQNVTCMKRPAAIPWSALTGFFPNLEDISVRFQSKNIDRLFASLGEASIAGKLKKLDVMEISGSAAETCSESLLQFNWDLISLQKLKLDCGFRTKAQDLHKILETQADTLQELHLFRAPFSRPYRNFPCSITLPHLTELHLWGNIASNLDFLILMPNLKVLKWNVSCYDERDHGARLHKYLKRKDLNPVFLRNIVENTNRLAPGFKLEKMSSLYIECGELTLQSWQALGAWMPNVKRLKATVVSDEQFTLIGRQWPDIEHIELAHGSRVSPKRILEVRLDGGSFQKLQGFIWKFCPCLNETAKNMRYTKGKLYAEGALKNLVGASVFHLWKGSDLAQQQRDIDNGLGVCLQNLFEMAIINGEAHVSKFLTALPK